MATLLRCTLLLIGFLVLAIAAGETEGAVLAAERVPMRTALLGTTAMLAVIALGASLVRILAPRGEGWRWSGLAVPTARHLAFEALVGALAGGLLLAVVVGAGWSLGWYTVVGVGGVPVAVLGFVLLSAAAGAFLEEIAFRGGLFTEARRRLPLVVALVVVSVPFAALHVMSAGFGAGFVLAAGVASVLFCLLRVARGTLWLAIGFHAAWNAVQYAVLGIGAATRPHGGHALVRFDRVGPPLWMGEGIAIKGGLLAGGALALAAALAGLHLVRRE